MTNNRNENEAKLGFFCRLAGFPVNHPGIWPTGKGQKCPLKLSKPAGYQPKPQTDSYRQGRVSPTAEIFREGEEKIEPAGFKDGEYSNSVVSAAAPGRLATRCNVGDHGNNTQSHLE